MKHWQKGRHLFKMYMYQHFTITTGVRNKCSAYFVLDSDSETFIRSNVEYSRLHIYKNITK